MMSTTQAEKAPALNIRIKAPQRALIERAARLMLLARLAVDHRWQGQGLGAALLRDAELRRLQAAELGGIQPMLVHAISTDAARFCRYFGIQIGPGNELMLMSTLFALLKALERMKPAVERAVRVNELSALVGSRITVAADR